MSIDKIPVFTANDENIYLPFQKNFPKATLYYTNEAYIFNNMLFVPDEIYKNLNFYKWFSKVFGVCPDLWIPRILNYKMVEIKETALFANYFQGRNYSHFTMQALGVLLLAKERNILSKKILVIKPKPTKFIDFLLKLINIENSITLENNVVYKLNSLFYSNVYFHTTYSHTLKPWNKIYIDLYNKNIKDLIYDTNITKIYIARRSKKRKCLNEEEVITFLAKFGYKTVYFDNISPLEQISLIESANSIIAPHGASGANFCYKSKKEFKFIEIFANRFVNWHTLILNSKNCNYSAIRCQAENNSIESDFKIDLTLLEKALCETSHKFKLHNEDNNIENNSIRNLTSTIPYIFNIHYNYEDNFKYVPHNSIITYHNTIIDLDDNNQALIHHKNYKSRISFKIFNNTISFHIDDLNKYIHSIDNLGNVTLSDQEKYFNIIFNYSRLNISIISNDLFLSARRNQQFKLVTNHLTWEHFYIKY